MTRSNALYVTLLLSLLGPTGCGAPDPTGVEATDVGDAADAASEGADAKRRRRHHRSRPVYGYSVHLSDELRFEPIQEGSDPERGRALFGVAADLDTPDPSEALFQGDSFSAGGEIVGNGRTCFTCHRGDANSWGLPAPPLTDAIAADDALFTGMQADAQGDPDALANLEQLGLIKYRPGRFNQARDLEDPFRQVFFWRKSPALLNIGLSHGLLLDGRGRAMLETARGAVFAHTQPDDVRFDDLFSGQDADDLTAFQFGIVSDPALLALRDPDHPLFDTLAGDPFATVEVTTSMQAWGRYVFQRDCMGCHDTPNVFNNRAGVRVLGTDGENPLDPHFGPHVGRSFNVGVSERNAHGLRFTRAMADGSFEPIVIPLANEDGSVNWHTVRFDIGLAATTGRTVDIGRFKVPQLRDVASLGPYFHDNSAATLEEVIDYFNSDAYNRSADGRRYPIRESAEERAALLEFLRVL